MLAATDASLEANDFTTDRTSNDRHMAKTVPEASRLVCFSPRLALRSLRSRRMRVGAGPGTSLHVRTRTMSNLARARRGPSGHAVNDRCLARPLEEDSRTWPAIRGTDPVANSQLDADAALDVPIGAPCRAHSSGERGRRERCDRVNRPARQGATDSFLERDLADASAVRAQEDVAEIAAALARIDAGTYGSCETCGSADQPQRLEVIPEARLCVACSAGSARTVAQQAVKSSPSVVSAKVAGRSVW